MPILNHEPDIYPDDLLNNQALLDEQQRAWWSLYTISRREKDLSRRLLARQISFYAPVVPKRYRSPQGRLRTSYIPLFANYVFLFATEEERAEAFSSNCIARCQKVTDRQGFVQDLQQIHGLISTGVPLTPEAKLEKGNPVRVKNGPFQGYEGVVIRREGKTRLLLALRFLQKGVSIELDEGFLEPL